MKAGDMAQESVSYRPRLADSELEDALARAGGVLVTGPKGCGKTETARRYAKSAIQADIDPQLEQQLAVLPQLVLEGDTPRLVDEWQVYPVLWDLARHEIDRRHRPGQFIFTGSTAPGEGAARHSGAGRFARLVMGTMTFAETGHSDSAVSLRELAQLPPGAAITPASSSLTVPDIAQRIAHGGWPGNLELSTEQARANNRDYLETVCAVDIRIPDNTYRDPQRVAALLTSLARGTATEMSVSALARDTGLARDSVRDYLDSLQRIFITTPQPAWRAHLRSAAPLREAPKHHLADPALAVAALHASERELLDDLEFFGQLFESQVVHDLRYLARTDIYHGRGADGLEVDGILDVGGRTALVEVKLGSVPSIIDGAAANLQRFARRYVKSTDPLLVVVTGSGLSYTRPDGVHVVAFGNLGA